MKATLCGESAACRYAALFEFINSGKKCFERIHGIVGGTVFKLFPF